MNEWMIERVEELKRKDISTWNEDDWADYQYIENYEVQIEYLAALAY